MQVGDERLLPDFAEQRISFVVGRRGRRIRRQRQLDQRRRQQRGARA
jgi:hypothetical protein